MKKKSMSNIVLLIVAYQVKLNRYLSTSLQIFMRDYPNLTSNTCMHKSSHLHMNAQKQTNQESS